MTNLERVQTILNQNAPNLSCQEKDNIIFLLGEVDTYQKKLTIGEQVAKIKRFEHVVNDIKVKDLVIPSPKYDHEIETREFQDLPCDVLVIGGGVTGCAILRELSKYQINAILLEKEEDVALHASGRNDGNIHPGVDLHRDSLKFKYLKLAKPMWPSLCEELGVKYLKTGQALAIKKDKILITLYARYKTFVNKLEHVDFLSRSDFFKREPNISKEIRGGIIFNDAAQVSPYEVTIALAESAITNGAKIYLNTIVKDMIVKEGEIKSVITNRGTIIPKIVINAAGAFSEDISKMAQDHFYSIHPRKGTDIILDKKVFSRYAKHTIGIKSVADTKSKTKGGGLVVTVDDNFLAGPDANEVPFKEDFSVDKQSIINILNKQKEMFPNISPRDVITYFSGIRACTYEEDFVIQKGKWIKNIVHAAGIQSPGLSCAPAIGQAVGQMAIDLLGGAKKKDNFIAKRQPLIRLTDLSLEEKDRLIKSNPNYGIIICRCEKVSKQEIIDALNRPLPVNSVDGIKRRVRAGMGRCQGGFCGPQVLKIMAETRNANLLEIKKKGGAHVLAKQLKVGN